MPASIENQLYVSYAFGTNMWQTRIVQQSTFSLEMVELFKVLGCIKALALEAVGGQGVG